jgi:amino acid adenylation domain-containing protein
LSIEQSLIHAWRARLELTDFNRSDNFFELGGDSLAALTIVNELASSGLAVSLADFYEHPTLNAQIAFLESAAPEKASGAAPSGKGRTLSLAPLQPTLILDSLSDPDSPAYWMVSALRFSVDVSTELARRAWAVMTEQNPALRTRLVMDPSGASQVIDSSAPGLWCTETLSLGPETTLEDWCSKQAAQLRESGLGKLVAGWFAASCPDAEGPDSGPVFVFAAHHALLDGWSLVQCLEDFAAVVSSPESRPRPRPSIAAYLDWCDSRGVTETSRAYWGERLGGAQPAQPLDFARSSFEPVGGTGREGRQRTRELLAPDDARLSRWCARHGVTRAALVAYAWRQVLARYTDETEVCIGLTVNIRPAGLPDSTRLSGCLINVVPLRVQHTGRSAATEVRETMFAMAMAAEHGHLTYPELCEAAGLPTNGRLFASTLVFQNFEGDLGALGAGSGAEPVARQVHGSGGTADPLSLTVGFGERTWLLAEWDESYYDGRVVESLLEALAYLVSHPEQLDQVKQHRAWLAPIERPLAYVGEPSPVRPWAIADYLNTGPDEAIAVEDSRDACTYAELRSRSQAMAAHLRHRLGLEPGDRVAFVGRRGVQAAVAICGAWQAGLTWCAVDSGLPDQRRQQLLDAFGPQRALALEEDLPRGPEPSADPTEFAETLPPERVAYLVATSGSTGSPKVVALSAGGLNPLVDAWKKSYPAGPEGHHVLQLGSWTADVFLGDLLKALSTGGRLVVCPDERRIDMAHLRWLIERHRVSLAESTPALVRALLRHIASTGQAAPPSLRTLIVGSDQFRAEELEEIRGLLWPTVRLVNGYGLSECTIESVVFDADGPTGDLRSGLCPIGTPLIGNQVDIVDGSGRQLPRGAIGEIRITGPGVGLGYLEGGKPRAVNGFGSREHHLSYTTGDFGRIDTDGTIQFFGRRDSQVKIRGHRVETGEIENTLLRFDGVDEVHVRAEETDGSVTLRAFVGSNSATSAERLRDELRAVLPEHGVPQTIDVMGRLPRTENGKVNRTALAARPVPAAPSARTDRSQTTPYITLVKEIWEDLLGRTVDEDRSFFDSGGNSILMIALFERLSNRFEKHDFTVADLFRYSTVAAFARFLNELGADVMDKSARGGAHDRMSVLHAVERGEITAQEGLRRMRELSG